MGRHAREDSQVQLQVCGPPVLRDEREDDEDGDGERVVVEHGVPVAEAHRLDLLAHREHLFARTLRQSLCSSHPYGTEKRWKSETYISSTRDTVQEHPNISTVDMPQRQRRERRRARPDVSTELSCDGRDGAGDVGPSGDDRGEDH